MIIKGVVTKGRALGRKLGFPTANIVLEGSASVQIENGVYRSRVCVGGVWYKAVSNVGVKPTVGSFERGVESHIIDFAGDIYGVTIEVELIEKLRDEAHFESLEALQAQVLKDIEKVKNIKLNK